MGNKNPAQAHKSTSRAATTLLAGLLAIALLAGCGDSTSHTTTTQANTPPPTTTTTAATTSTSSTTTTSTPTTQTTAREPERIPPTARILISSQAVPASGEIPARYTCDGQDTPPPLEIKGVPPHTAELMIAVMGAKDVDNKIQFAWAATHIPPTTRKIINGKLPPGAILGTNSNGETGYHLCPPKGAPETYVTVLWTLPHKLPAPRGFDPRTLRHLVEHQATYQNLLFFHYTRH